MQSVKDSFSLFVQRLDFIARRNGVANGIEGIIFSATLEGASLFLVAWSAYLYFHLSGKIFLIIIMASAFFPLIANIAFHFAKMERETRKMERQLPDSLLLWSSFPSTLSFEQAISECAQLSELPLKREWELLHHLIQKGKSVPAALEKWGLGFNSRPLNHARQLFTRAYASGASIQTLCASLAEEGIASQSLLEERRATMLVEKFTILIAGGLIVPVLLGVMVGVVASLAIPSTSEWISSTPDLLPAALVSIRGYLALYALIASAFVGLQEGKPANAALYALILLPLAQVAYTLGKWFVGSAAL